MLLGALSVIAVTVLIYTRKKSKQKKAQAIVRKDDNGTVTADEFCLADLTHEIKQHKLDQKMRVEMFRKRVLAMVQPIVVADKQSMKIVFANPAVNKIFGWATNELEEMPVELLMMSEDAKKHCEHIRRYKLGLKGNIVGHQGRRVVGKHKNGGALHLFLSVADPDDGTFVASFTDLTAEIRERQWKEDYQKFLHDNLLLALNFTAHETRNLLAPLQLVLEAEPATKEETGFCIELISSVMANVLLVSQLASTKHVFDRSDFFCDELLERLEQVGQMCVRSPVTFNCIRSGTSGILISAPEDDIEETIRSFLRNAGDFTKTGSVSLISSLRSLPGGCNKAIFEVKVIDEGCGMNPDFLNMALKPFGLIRTVHPSRNMGQNDGVKGCRNGLCFPIAKAIAEQNGGDLEITSTVNRGTQVRIWWEVGLRKPTSKPGSLVTVVSKLLSEEFILAVDDNAVVRKMYSSWAKRQNLKLMLAESGEEAICLVATHQFTTILMDKDMGGINGIEAAKSIRTASFSGRIALVSGSVLSKVTTNNLISSGVIDYFFVKGGSPSWQTLFGAQLHKKRRKKDITKNTIQGS